MCKLPLHPTKSSAKTFIQSLVKMIVLRYIYFCLSAASYFQTLLLHHQTFTFTDALLYFGAVPICFLATGSLQFSAQLCFATPAQPSFHSTSCIRGSFAHSQGLRTSYGHTVLIQSHLFLSLFKRHLLNEFAVTPVFSLSLSLETRHVLYFKYSVAYKYVL